MKIRVDNGKYTYCYPSPGETPLVRILRHGEPWHEIITNDPLHSLLCELDAARVVLAAARALGDDAPMQIRDALKTHAGLVDDREPPSEWAR